MSEEGAGDKEFDPSEQRLREARAEGRYPRSADLVTAAAWGGFAFAAAAFGGAAAAGIGSAGMVLLGQADRLAPLWAQGAAAPARGILAATAVALLPFVALPAAAAILCLVAQRALALTPANLAPRADRISPLAALRHKFGRAGLFEFAKSFVKLALTAAILFAFVAAQADRIAAAAALSPGVAAAELGRLLLAFLLPVCLLALVLGLLDFAWQRADHLRQHRMSRQEMADEMKSSEGDPHLRARRRQKGHDIATNRMLVEVARADVVVVNPSHYAVALRWDRAAGGAPRCVAKGVDEVAARIRARAAEAGVPLHRDPPTARALHARVEIGQAIRPEHYRAVAAAIRFADVMRARRRGRGG